MHSSRMRTVRCSGSWGDIPGCTGQGGVCPGAGCLPGECLPGDVCLGNVCPGGVSAQGGVCLRGCLPGGMSAQGVSAGGVSGAHPSPLWTE